MRTKVCNVCGKEKDIEDFYKNKTYTYQKDKTQERKIYLKGTCRYCIAKKREPTRVCNSCGKERDIEKFSLTGSGTNKRRWRLRVCNSCRLERQERFGGKTFRNRQFECVHDPSGSYRGTITKGAIRDTMKGGLMPPGSKWRCKQEKTVYVVIGNEHWHTMWECVKKPDPDYLEEIWEEQRLVRI